MLNVRDLEDQWLKYKIKSYYPYLFGASIVFILLITIFFYTQQDSTKVIPEPTIIKNEKIHVKENIVSNPKTVLETKIEKELTIEKKEKIIPKILQQNTSILNTTDTPKRLKPSFSFLDAIDREPTTKVIKKPQIPKPKKINTTITPAIEEKPIVADKVVTTKSKQSVPTGIKIDHTKTHKEVQDIVHRFENNKNPALGLYLARYYYKMKNYEKSYNYALNTNHIDSDIEESWLIFASSQVKLGKKDNAIKTLIAYIKNSDSINAKNLLHSIRTGEFQ
jgi:tetratricopeptide (TPR) repeat protein